MFNAIRRHTSYAPSTSAHALNLASTRIVYEPPQELPEKVLATRMISS